MRWIQTLGVAAVLGALTSRSLVAQQDSSLAVIVSDFAFDTAATPTWAEMRSAMMRTTERDLRTLDADQTPSQAGLRLGRINGALILELFSSQPLFILEPRKSHDCPKAARQS